MKRRIWIVSEGSPGHTSQSQGLVDALASRIDLECSTIETRPKLGGISRWWVRNRMGPQGKPVAWRLLHRMLGCETPPTHQAPPDLIICSGGKSVFAARTLAACYHAPLVYIGERKPYPASWFHTVFTPSEMETETNDIPIELIPTRITREAVDQAAGAWKGRPNGKIWTMLIGGASRSHRYTRRDWLALAEGINTWTKRDGIRWLITTSPRTGSKTETLLRRAIDPQAIAKAVWWAENPEKNLPAFLGAAEGICVTQDSVTMVTEAVSAGKPVVVLRPSITTFAKTSFLPGYFSRLEEKRRIVREKMPEFASLELSGRSFLPRMGSIQTELAATLMARMPLE